MHLQPIEYRYEGDVDGFIDAAEQVAPTIAAMDGFVAKLWLNGDEQCFGGVSLWRDRQAADAYEQSDFFKAAISSSPNVRNLTISHYELWAAPTAITNGSDPVARSGT